MLQLNDTTWVVADAGQPFTDKEINDLKITVLQDSALQLRPDLAFVKNQSIFQQHNIVYQRALAKPDLTVGIEYDKLSSYTPNLVGLAISLPIPIFNKNKGNIAAAQYAYKQNNIVVQDVQNQVSKDVLGAWKKLTNATSMLNADNSLLSDNYEMLMKNMVESYRQRHVSLIEFIDFFDAYKETRIKQWQQATNQRNAAAELNFSINQNIIKL